MSLLLDVLVCGAIACGCTFVFCCLWFAACFVKLFFRFAV